MTFLAIFNRTSVKRVPKIALAGFPYNSLGLLMVTNAALFKETSARVHLGLSVYLFGCLFGAIVGQFCMVKEPYIYIYSHWDHFDFIFLFSVQRNLYG